MIYLKITACQAQQTFPFTVACSLLSVPVVSSLVFQRGNLLINFVFLQNNRHAAQDFPRVL